MIDKAPKLNRVEYIRSDISGKLFPASECEMVVIKIKKHKSEDLNDYNPLPKKNEIKEDRSEEYKVPINTNVSPTPTIIPNIDSPEFKAAMQRRNSAIPPAMRDLFSKPPEVS